MTRGGYRQNAKRPLKFGEEATRITIQVPKSRKEEIRGKVENILKRYIKKHIKSK